MNGLKIVRSIPAMFLSTPHNLTHTGDREERLFSAIMMRDGVLFGFDYFMEGGGV